MMVIPLEKKQKMFHDETPFARGNVLNKEQSLVLVKQQTLLFYGKPIIVVRLLDECPSLILSVLYENLQIDTTAQIARVRRTNAIANDLVSVRVETTRSPQTMLALVLRAVPF